jgi:hypothetical protein
MPAKRLAASSGEESVTNAELLVKFKFLEHQRSVISMSCQFWFLGLCDYGLSTSAAAPWNGKIVTSACF